MKTNHLNFILIAILSFLVTSCENDDSSTDLVSVVVPVVQSKADIRNSISITSPRPTNGDGKIYVYEDLLFYIAQSSGIHIFDNQNPNSPENLAFIELDGVNDIAVKNDMLYADNFTDLVVFDISSISSIELVNTEEDLFYYYADFPEETMDFVRYYNFNSQDEIITKYEVVELSRDDVESRPDLYYNMGMPTLGSGEFANSIGVGGSLAKFQIYSDALYSLQNYSLKTFDISDYNSISLTSESFISNWMGGELETTFIQKSHLFIGATNGMHILDLADEFNPVYLSSFTHATGCDPVVVEGNTAYITVRGGNSCGAIEDQINVIDVSDMSNPVEYSTYFLSSPYGLGVRNRVLYVCNDDGLQVFNAQNPSDIILKNSYPATIKDVIPLATHLIGVGENVIYQFDYKNEFQLELISEIEF